MTAFECDEPAEFRPTSTPTLRLTWRLSRYTERDTP